MCQQGEPHHHILAVVAVNLYQQGYWIKLNYYYFIYFF